MVTPYSYEFTATTTENMFQLGYGGLYPPTVYPTPVVTTPQYLPYMDTSIYSSSKSESEASPPSADPKKNDPKYKEKREKNNLAARKSRNVRSEREKETRDKISRQHIQIDKLKEQIHNLQAQLSVQHSHQSLCYKCSTSISSDYLQNQPLRDVQNIPSLSTIHPFNHTNKY